MQFRSAICTTQQRAKSEPDVDLEEEEREDAMWALAGLDDHNLSSR